MLDLFRYFKVPSLYESGIFILYSHGVGMNSSWYEFRNLVSYKKNQNVLNSPVNYTHENH